MAVTIEEPTREGATPERPFLSDELLGQLMAVGQADVLVGLPTYNNAATVGPVVRAVHAGLARHFPRSRTLVINSDGGSTDGTPDVVRGAALDESETLLARHALRTIHRISAPYHGVPGKRRALRTLFTAAELIQAKAVMVLDPSVTSVTPDWVASLLQPILVEQFDVATPIYARHPFEAPLVTQLVRPLFRSAFAQRIAEPATPELGCSGRFVSWSLRQDYWEGEGARDTIDLWLLASAFAGDLQVCQAHVGARVVGEQPDRPALPQLFHQLVGGLFACLEAFAPHWSARTSPGDVPVLGQPKRPQGEPPAIDPAPLLEAFVSGASDIDPVLETLFAPQTLEWLRRCVADGEARAMSDDLWAAVLFESAASYHRAPIHRDHVVQALVPLYLGRLASFVMTQANDSAAVPKSLEALGLEFERSRPYLIDRWNLAGGR
jgi:hypothetical protein